MGATPRWVGDDLYYLLNLPISVLVRIYPQYTKGTLKGKKAFWKAKIKRGEIVMPPKPENSENLGRENLDHLNIPQDDNLLMTGGHYGYIKNSEGEIEYTDLLPRFKARSLINPNEILSQADPTIIKPTRGKPITRKEQQALIITDAQMWMGRTDAGELYPFHDPVAMDIVNQIGKQEQPNQVVIVGDFVDFPNLSKFKQEKAFEDTLQASLNAVHRALAEVRANNPNARISLLEGNHEKRLRNYIYDKARQLYGLEALDIRNLLRLNEVEVDYIDGYPNGRYWLNDRIKVVHGETVKQLGKTVTNLIRNDDTSSITGHIHRFEMATRTIPGRHTGRLIMAASFGTLSRIDGAVPSYHSSHDDQGRPTLHIEQWQQGAGMVTFTPGDKPFDIQPIIINTFDDYETRYNGKVYKKQ